MEKIYISKFDEDKEEFKIGLQLLEKVGVSTEIKTLNNGDSYLELVIDLNTYNRSVKRHAGRPMVYVQENGHYKEKSIVEVRKMMKELGPDKTAAKLGISRRTLYRKLEKARKENDDAIY